MRPAPTALVLLLRDLDRDGFSIGLRATQIALRPAERLTPELRERIQELRPELIEILGWHGEALLPLFREPVLPLSDPERRTIALNATAIRAARAGRNRGAA